MDAVEKARLKKDLEARRAKISEDIRVLHQELQNEPEMVTLTTKQWDDIEAMLDYYVAKDISVPGYVQGLELIYALGVARRGDYGRS